VGAYQLSSHSSNDISVLASFPGSRRFWLHEECGGPGSFSHMRDIKGRKDLLNVSALRLRTARVRYQVTYQTYVASVGRLLYTQRPAFNQYLLNSQEVTLCLWIPIFSGS